MVFVHNNPASLNSPKPVDRPGSWTWLSLNVLERFTDMKFDYNDEAVCQGGKLGVVVGIYGS